MEIKTKFNAGDKVFIGYIANSKGERYQRICGPVTICHVNLTMTQDNQPEGVKTKTTCEYTINSLDQRFNECGLHATMGDAVNYCCEQFNK